MDAIRAGQTTSALYTCPNCLTKPFIMEVFLGVICVILLFVAYETLKLKQIQKYLAQ